MGHGFHGELLVITRGYPGFPTFKGQIYHELRTPFAGRRWHDGRFWLVRKLDCGRAFEPPATAIVTPQDMLNPYIKS